MFWKAIPGDTASLEPDGDLDRIVIDDLPGDDNALSYLGQIALFMSDNNIRTGYDVQITGGCNKGPQGIQWGTITVVFEETDDAQRVIGHLQTIWGTQDEPRELRLDDDEAARARAYL